MSVRWRNFQGQVGWFCHKLGRECGRQLQDLKPKEVVMIKEKAISYSSKIQLRIS